MKEHDIIVAKANISTEINAKTKGVILSVYDDGESFLVEFIDQNGETIENGMTTVNKNQIELFQY